MLSIYIGNLRMSSTQDAGVSEIVAAHASFMDWVVRPAEPEKVQGAICMFMHVYDPAGSIINDILLGS
jgi:hypothetical protein